MPFVVPPFGMTDWTAQTRQNKLGTVSYKYDDTSISGFMGTHQPAIWMGDYGYVTLMPEVDGLKTNPEARKLTYKHIDEMARPDYYSVLLDAGKGRAIRTEMTATDRCALMRFTFPANAASMIVVEASRAEPGEAGCGGGEEGASGKGCARAGCEGREAGLGHGRPPVGHAILRKP